MEKLYVKFVERYSESESEGFVPFEIISREKLNDEMERIIAKDSQYGEVEFKLHNNMYIAYKNNVYFNGVLDIVEYYEKNDKWIMRPIDDIFIDGMNDHIEEAYELKVVYASPDNKYMESEYYEILNPSNIEEGIDYAYNQLKNENEENEIIYAALIQRIRKWVDGEVSHWEKGEMTEYLKEDIEKIIK